MGKKKLILTAAIVLIALIIMFRYYTDWLWFKNLGFSGIFWTVLLTKLTTGVIVGLVFFGIFWGNLHLAHRMDVNRGIQAMVVSQESDEQVPPIGFSATGMVILIASIFLAMLSGLIAFSKWNMILKYLHPISFEISDPIFNKDVGFYVFSLPFYSFLQSWFFSALILTLLGIIWVYIFDGAIQTRGQLRALPHAVGHVSGMIGGILLVAAWGYRLKIFRLLYSSRGVAYGANYTDHNVQIYIYWILTIAAIVIGALLFLNIFGRRLRYVVLGVGVFISAVILIGSIPSALVQNLIVEPNELAKESSYIRHNINFTRQAYNLNQIKEEDFPASEDLTLKDLEENEITIQNIRIWDERPLLRTYSQIQEIRLYYDFASVDVDRYYIEGRYRQVMLSPRELVTSQIPAKGSTWVNKSLKYTHGYGLALSPVNQVTAEGLPKLLIKDVPPVSSADISITRPEIYYGEKTKNYVITKTKTPEFDYPKGDENEYAIYQGKGGVRLNNFLKRLAFAIRLTDINILISTYITPDSQLMLHRSIDQRQRAIAPFLEYDSDPYIVVSDEGRLFWIQDAYTTTNMFPYSEPVRRRGINYIRNSVKVVIDAYNGDLSFFVVDEKDPIIRSYEEIFPGVFKSYKEMPESLRKHIRYPKDYFHIQAFMYQSYHMEDVQVFYNQEDLWQMPSEMYSENRQPMEAYYIIIKLPGQEKEEFLLMVPFTPSKKDNMIAWLAARNDIPHYGQLLVYKLPKEKLIFGPMQIEARVDQQPEISRELTLWGQRGSRVIRGNLLVIPVNRSFIYVEPVYLEARLEQEFQPASGPTQVIRSIERQQATTAGRTASSAALPELKMVIAAFGNRLAMRENLKAALEGVVSGGGSAPEKEAIPVREVGRTGKGLPKDLEELVSLARVHYDNARDALRNEDWARFGKEWSRLHDILEKLDKSREEAYF